MDKKLRKDLKVLVLFVDLYCRQRHAGEQRQRVDLKSHDLDDIYKRPVELCTECRKLLTHALVKRSNCPLEPKPACKDCPVHCYHPDYRRKIQEVMRYSGRQMVFRGRLDYLYKLLF